MCVAAGELHTQSSCIFEHAMHDDGKPLSKPYNAKSVLLVWLVAYEAMQTQLNCTRRVQNIQAPQ